MDMWFLLSPFQVQKVVLSSISYQKYNPSPPVLTSSFSENRLFLNKKSLERLFFVIMHPVDPKENCRKFHALLFRPMTMLCLCTE